jgi:hypothetical protein
MFRVLLNNRKDACRYDSMGAAEIVVDFFRIVSMYLVLVKGGKYLGGSR